MNNLQSQNKPYEMGGATSNKTILAWHPVRVFATATHSLAAPDLFTNQSEVDLAPWGTYAAV